MSGNAAALDGRKRTDPNTKLLRCLTEFRDLPGIEVDPPFGYPLRVAVAVPSGHVVERSLVLTAPLSKTNEPGGHLNRVLVAIDVHAVFVLSAVDGQIPKRVALFDGDELVLERAEGLEEVWDGIASKLAILLIGEQKAVPVGVRGGYMEKTAFRHVPAVVLTKPFQAHRLGGDRPLVGH